MEYSLFFVRRKSQENTRWWRIDCSGKCNASDACRWFHHVILNWGPAVRAKRKRITRAPWYNINMVRRSVTCLIFIEKWSNKTTPQFIMIKFWIILQGHELISLSGPVKLRKTLTTSHYIDWRRGQQTLTPVTGQLGVIYNWFIFGQTYSNNLTYVRFKLFLSYS